MSYVKGQGPRNARVFETSAGSPVENYVIKRYRRAEKEFRGAEAELIAAIDRARAGQEHVGGIILQLDGDANV